MADTDEVSGILAVADAGEAFGWWKLKGDRRGQARRTLAMIMVAQYSELAVEEWLTAARALEVYMETGHTLPRHDPRESEA